MLQNRSALVSFGVVSLLCSCPGPAQDRHGYMKLFPAVASLPSFSVRVASARVDWQLARPPFSPDLRKNVGVRCDSGVTHTGDVTVLGNYRS